MIQKSVSTHYDFEKFSLKTVRRCRYIYTHTSQYIIQCAHMGINTITYISLRIHTKFYSEHKIYCQGKFICKTLKNHFICKIGYFQFFIYYYILYVNIIIDFFPNEILYAKAVFPLIHSVFSGKSTLARAPCEQTMPINYKYNSKHKQRLFLFFVQIIFVWLCYFLRMITQHGTRDKAE